MKSPIGGFWEKRLESPQQLIDPFAYAESAGCRRTSPVRRFAHSDSKASLGAILSNVRTTVTLDSDTEQIVHQRMAERRVSFKQALNDLVREGWGSADGSRQFKTTTRPMGRAKVDLDKALRLAGELEDGDNARGLGADLEAR